jgi:Asp-tRNA(Asn)/Glu-tRNA(Gln) amidotransferase A subunit family amidase
VLTVCGEHAIFNRYVTPAVYREYMSRGISDSTRGEIMRDALGSSWDYYRETYQRRQYIMRNWQAFFDVVAIKAAAHNNYQDAVILRKRSR